MGCNHFRPLSYAICENIFKTEKPISRGSWKGCYKLAFSAYLMRLMNVDTNTYDYLVRVHDTNILTYRKSSSGKYTIEIYIHIHQTKTTKDRLRWFLPECFDVECKKGFWKLTFKGNPVIHINTWQRLIIPVRNFKGEVVLVGKKIQHTFWSVTQWKHVTEDLPIEKPKK